MGNARSASAISGGVWKNSQLAYQVAIIHEPRRSCYSYTKAIQGNYSAADSVVLVGLSLTYAFNSLYIVFARPGKNDIQEQDFCLWSHSILCVLFFAPAGVKNNTQ